MRKNTNRDRLGARWPVTKLLKIFWAEEHKGQNQGTEDVKEGMEPKDNSRVEWILCDQMGVSDKKKVLEGYSLGSSWEARAKRDFE